MFTGVLNISTPYEKRTQRIPKFLEIGVSSNTMTEPPSDRRLRSLYHQLVATGERRGIPREDAEELANDTLLAVIEKFDPARGRLETFAQHVLKNKIVNFARDHKLPGTVPFDDERHAGPGTPEEMLTRKEEMEMMKRRRAQLLTALTEEEARFLLEFEVVLDELGDRAVSETARHLDLTPREGHNIIQRIERKAEKIAASTRGGARPEMIRSVSRDPEMAESTPEALKDMLVMAKFSAAFSRIPPAGYRSTADVARAGLESSREGLGRFLNALDPLRREKLLSFVS
jgi:DNA-directed RNA polymerase specialized sigma24 family protein